MRRNRVGDGDEFERRRRSGGPQFNSSGVEVERTRAELGVVVDLLLGRSGGGDDVELVRGGVGSRGSRWACEGWRAWPRVHAPRAGRGSGDPATRWWQGSEVVRRELESSVATERGRRKCKTNPLQVFYYHH